MEGIKNYFRLLAENKQNGFGSEFWKIGLSLFSFVYGFAVRTRRSFYEKNIFKRSRLPYPVISIGNITWGGTGKTPFAELLARKISTFKKTPLVLTRGYSHDEALELQHHLPMAVVGVGRDRLKVARRVAEEKRRVDVALLDDGFQHQKLFRDAEWILINAINPFGNGKLIPRGILREPLETLSRASVIVITHGNLISLEENKKLKETLKSFAPQAQFVETAMEPLFLYRAKTRVRFSLDKLEGKKVATFAGVGTPRSFQLLLQRAGLKTVRNFEFLDHHNYSRKDLKQIKDISQSAAAEEILTTEKDFFRAKNLISEHLNPLVLAARMKIVSGEDVLTEQITSLLGVNH